LVAVISKGNGDEAVNALTLRLYDVRGRHMITPSFRDSERFRPIRQQAVRNLKGLVSSMSYSPDDLFLAVARDDNSVDIFDSRFLQEPVQTCEHAAGEEGSEHVYGISCMQWLAHREGSPYVLLTGGDDGAWFAIESHFTTVDPLRP
jgi:WD40 repeat protein